MATLLLKIIPILGIAASLCYALLWGVRLNRSKGLISAAAIAGLFAGLAAGRLYERAVWPASFPADVSDLAALSVETALQFSAAALICAVGVNVVRRDALAPHPPGAGSRGLARVWVLVILGFIVAAHEKVAIALTHVLERMHLL